MDQVSGMRWAVTAAGGAVNDMLTGERIYSCEIDPETAKWIIAAAAGTDVFPLIFINDAAYCPGWAEDRAEEFHVAPYAEMYRKYMTKVEDVFEFFMENPAGVQKFNLLFTNPQEKEEVYERIKLLPVSFTTNTRFSMEINAPGVSKANGLKKLCGRLGISMEECAAVGDADNDLEILRAVGLGIAMGNALPRVKEAAGAVVSDCDHDGAAEAIERFLLSDA
jgi:Cof subfamily protein (haloacid dehalogenase superfamily)